MVDREQLRKKWIKALRSERYEQGKGQLRYVREGQSYFCCLGVLCDVWDKDLWTEEIAGTYCHDGREALPDAEICNAIGLTWYTLDSLTDMNDDGGFSFSEIADELEKRPEDFFVDDTEEVLG